MIRKFFSLFPFLEVTTRILYWKFSFFHILFKKLKFIVSSKGSTTINSKISLQSLKNELINHGISKGDILIVHSSMQSLSSTGARPSQIIDMLVDLLGEDGTLVMPAIPRYREASKGIKRISQDLSNEIWSYDVKKTPPWTGALPYRLMKMTGVIRSSFPLNTVVALGRHARAMLGKELSSHGETPCGKNSSWAYCYNHNAKILMLGVDLAHNLTMIHVAEDYFEASWPIKNWYRPRKFQVTNEGHSSIFNVRERHPKWAMCYAENKLNRDLFKYNIARQSQIESLKIISLRSSSLIEFLKKRQRSGYPYFWCNFFS